MRRKIIAVSTLCVLILAGCGLNNSTVSSEPVTNTQALTEKDADNVANEESTDTQAVETEGIKENENGEMAEPLLNINGQIIGIGYDIASMVDAIGTPDEFQSAASCLGEGEDKIYTYSGVSLYTHPSGEKDLIYLIEIGEGGSLACDIGVNSSFTDMLNTFGSQYTQDDIYYTYVIDKIAVTFEVTDNKITYIELVRD